MKFEVKFIGVNPEGKEVTALRTEIIDPAIDNLFYSCKNKRKLKKRFEDVANSENAIKDRGYVNVVKKVSIYENVDG